MPRGSQSSALISAVHILLDWYSAICSKWNPRGGGTGLNQTNNKKEGKIVSKKTHENFTVGEDRQVGTVTIGNDHQPITGPGRVSRLVTKRSYISCPQFTTWHCGKSQLCCSKGRAGGGDPNQHHQQKHLDLPAFTSCWCIRGGAISLTVQFCII